MRGFLSAILFSATVGASAMAAGQEADPCPLPEAAPDPSALERPELVRCLERPPRTGEQQRCEPKEYNEYVKRVNAYIDALNSYMEAMSAYVQSAQAFAQCESDAVRAPLDEN